METYEVFIPPYISGSDKVSMVHDLTIQAREAGIELVFTEEMGSTGLPQAKWDCPVPGSDSVTWLGVILPEYSEPISEGNRAAKISRYVCRNLHPHWNIPEGI